MTQPKIKVIGIGNGGINAVNLMIEHKLNGLEFVAIDTDITRLNESYATEKILFGNGTINAKYFDEKLEITENLAQGSKEKIRDILKESDMVFLVAGLGGATGSNFAPVIAEVAKEIGILTISIITKPLRLEGKMRTERASNAQEKLKNSTDSLISVNTDKLFETMQDCQPINDVFKLADEVILSAIQCIADIISVAGLISVDFDDIKSVLSSSGSGLLGIGMASGENAALNAAKLAIDSKYSDCQLTGAKGVIINVTGGSDMTLFEVNEAASVISDAIADNAEIVFGSIVDDRLNDDDIQVTIIATGFNDI